MTQDSNSENKILYFYKGLDVTTLRSCDEEEIKSINERGYDVFWCLQTFTGSRRIKEDLVRINYINADFDNIELDAFWKRLRNCPKPTMLIKTRSGFHAYWRTNDVVGYCESAEEYRSFVEERIVPLGADPNAKDACRILRVPNSRYWQDSKGNRYEDQEIRCEVIYDNGPEWSFEQLQRLFPRSVVSSNNQGSAKIYQRPYESSSSSASDPSGFWSRCNAIPVLEGIARLSGTPAVRGQKLTTRSEGKIKRLLVNGNPSNGWIDANGRFGSTYENTAGTLVNFLKFPEYGLDNSAIAKVFKEIFNVT